MGSWEVVNKPYCENRKDLKEFNTRKSREFIKDVENLNKRAKYNIRHINALADYFDMSPRDFLPEKPMRLSTEKNKERAPQKKKTAAKKQIRRRPATTKKKESN